MKVTFMLLLLLCGLLAAAQQPASLPQPTVNAKPKTEAKADTAKKTQTAVIKPATNKALTLQIKPAVALQTKDANTVLVKPANQQPIAYRSRVSFQVVAGSQGVGADVKYGLFKKLSMRVGAAFVPINVNNAFSFSGFQSENQLAVKFSNAHLLLDFSPFKGHGFRLVAGAGYFSKGDGNVSITPNGTYKYGDIPISKEEVGNLHINTNWKGVAPYFGFGLFKEFPKHFLNVGLDIGSYYLQQPKVTIIGTGVLSGNTSQQALVTSNMKDYRFLPVIQLNFNFRIK